MTKIFCAALAVAISCAPAFAATQKPSEKKSAEKPAQAPLPTTDDAVKKLAALDQDIRTLQFDFEQTLFFDDTGITREVTGKVSFAKPDKIRIDHYRPQAQTVYTDKKTILIYKPADRQAVKSSWKQWLSQQASTLTGIAELGDYSSLASKHDLSVSRDKSGRLLLALTPKSNPKAYTITMALSETDVFPSGITFAVGKTRFETVIKNAKKNADIPPGIFEFKQPAGVDLIDFSEPPKQ